MKSINRWLLGDSMLNIWLKCLLLFAIALCTTSVFSQNYYVISNQPQSFVTPTKTWPAYLYSVNISDKEFAKIADLSDDTLGVWFIGVYPGERLFTIGYGTTNLKYIKTISMENIGEMHRIVFPEGETIISNHLLYDSIGEIFLNVESISKSNGQLREHNYDIPASIRPLKSDFRTSRILLTGASPSISSGYADIESVVIDENGDLKFKNNAYNNVFGLPKIDIPFEYYDSKWKIIANEENYLALSEVPRSLEGRLLLTYSRKLNEWTIYNVEGDTKIRPIGDWMTGRWMLYNPKSNYENKTFYAPLSGSKVYLINPETGKMYIFDLGFDSEILWVENSIILYRIGRELYSGRLDGDSIVDRNMIVSDSIVGEIHWAFPAKGE